MRSVWRDAPTESRIFAGTAAYFVLAGVVYGLSADDRAGATLLIGAAGFGFGYAAWLFRHLPATQEAVIAQEESDELYLPHESAWPLVLGTGSVLLMTGLAIGLWLALPGALLMVRGLVGLASESRRRA